MAFRIENCIITTDTAANSKTTVVIFFSEPVPHPNPLLMTNHPKVHFWLLDPITAMETPAYEVTLTANTFDYPPGGATLTLTPFPAADAESLTVDAWIKVAIRGHGWNKQLGSPNALKNFRAFDDEHDGVFYTRVKPGGDDGGGVGGGGMGDRLNGGIREPVSDLQSFPVLTQEFSHADLPSSSTAGVGSPISGTSALGLSADKAIREVLSWRTKSDDPKGFMGALTQAFDLKEVEGHTEWNWTPRSYTVQTDMGAVTGAQASIYTRAKVALDQSLPLLDGLYPLVPAVEAEDLATVQAVVRTQFSALVNEFGVVGGPRVPRVDELFQLLLGHGDPTNPEDIKRSGSLGLTRQRFGLERRFVTTVDDEQNLTNFLILVDYVIGLNQSWKHYRTFFVRTVGGDTERQPFFGTQLVLMSRALEVVSQGVQDAYYTMDSVFMGDSERQTAQLIFRDLVIRVPDPETQGEAPYRFPRDTSGLFVAELLDWVYRSASEELPGLLQDAGKDGLESFKLVTDRLRRFVRGAIGQHAPGIPPGYHTPRVKRAMQLLADGLDDAYRLALQIKPPDFPAELTPRQLTQIMEILRPE